MRREKLMRTKLRINVRAMFVSAVEAWRFVEAHARIDMRTPRYNAIGPIPFASGDVSHGIIHRRC